MSTTPVTILKSPNDVFSIPPPAPCPWTSSTPPPPRTPALWWKKCSPENSRLKSTLSGLANTLRCVHKRKVSWPADESFLSTLPTTEYLQHLLQPITNLYNELHAPGAFPNPVECVRVNLGNGMNGVTFVARGAKLWEGIPIVLSFPEALFDTQGNPSLRTISAVSKALEYDPTLKTIIVTDFKDIAVFQTPSYIEPERIFTRISTSEPALALRVLTMAYMNDLLLGGYFINSPGVDLEDEDKELGAHGPPINPDDPLMPDEQVFATHRRYSDFDEPTLLNDSARATQFFRWVKHVRQHCPKVVVHPGDEVGATARGVPFAKTMAQPTFPFDRSQLPTETAEHLHTIQRQSPLAINGIEDALASSNSFSIKIEGIVSEGSNKSISTVYRCRIVSIDGKRVSDSPDLCLKLFDDRFQPKECPNEDDEASGEDIERYNRMVRYYMPWRKPEDTKVVDDYERRDYFISAAHADQLAMTEAAAYDKLRSVQGSFIPWFYGVYTFTLPDGMRLYGLLMEYIEGTKLHSGADIQDPEISADRQIALIKSCRHGARVLDIADIAQHDWHRGQVLLYTNPTSKIDHAMFIDFASTSQTYSVDNMVLTRNYINLFMVLSGRCGSVWLDEELVWDNYGEPDDSDPVVAFLRRGKEPITIEARGKFTFITAV
ncbi:hypothetical protein BDY19DRAFT_904509 [Irpex rosettiformis]|uniref:Uncharacterized protein n=1 Tax=Irpex rosettiformis TaxID=378272 RepID=A0ACB8U9U7_9APHY|nr:hypothetical protein BDY19DRAFT_904509 [Irpex rosettiformis]